MAIVHDEPIPVVDNVATAAAAVKTAVKAAGEAIAGGVQNKHQPYQAHQQGQAQPRFTRQTIQRWPDYRYNAYEEWYY
jgi:hypothetical protein